MGKLAQLRKELQNHWDVDIVTIGSITVGIVTFVLTVFGQTTSTAVLGLTLTMLGLVAISLRRDRQTERNLAKNKAFEQQCDAYRFLINDVINQYGAREAVLLQYSCKTSLDLLRTLLSKGAKVTVFIQHEDTPAKMGSQLQADRIVDTTKNLRSDLGNSPLKLDKLKVYKYRAPSSVSGIKIDNRVLCMGWYTYEQVDRAAYKSYASDTIEISGHDVAAVVAWRGTGEFEALDKTFSMLEKSYRKSSEKVLV
jgi:hypothetical protein